MKADAFNSHVEPVITKINGTQQILISHICDSDESESKTIIIDKNLSEVYSTDEIKLESVIVYECSTQESESEIIHKIINREKEKDAIDVTEDEGPLVTDNLVINEPSYFNLFKCGKNIQNKLTTSMHGNLNGQVLYRNA